MNPRVLWSKYIPLLPCRQWQFWNAVCGYVPFHFFFIGKQQQSQHAIKSCDFRWSHSLNQLNSHVFESFQSPRVPFPSHHFKNKYNKRNLFPWLRWVSHDSWYQRWDNNIAPKWTAWNRKQFADMHWYVRKFALAYLAKVKNACRRLQSFHINWTIQLYAEW